MLLTIIVLNIMKSVCKWFVKLLCDSSGLAGDVAVELDAVETSALLVV